MKRWALLAMVLALGAGAWFAWSTRRPARAPGSAAGIPSDSLRAGVRAVRLYFADSGGDSLTVEPREIVEPASFRDRVTALVAELDRGPRGRGVSALPAGTSVSRVFLDDHGLLTLDLSGAFRRSFRGGSNAEYLAVASLVRTLSANLPEVRRVRLCSAGRPMASLRGHIPLDQPLDVAEGP